MILSETMNILILGSELLGRVWQWSQNFSITGILWAAWESVGIFYSLKSFSFLIRILLSFSGGIFIDTALTTPWEMIFLSMKLGPALGWNFFSKTVFVLSTWGGAFFLNYGFKKSLFLSFVIYSLRDWVNTICLRYRY